jgi:hypothetical protein
LAASATFRLWRRLESDIILFVDAQITHAAGVGLEAVRRLKPRTTAWGLLLGHERGGRFVVEGVFPAGGSAALPATVEFDALNRLWEGRLIGLYALRPGPSLRKSVLGPYFFGKLFLELGRTARGAGLKAFTVEFDRRFYFSAVPVVSGRRGAGG